MKLKDFLRMISSFDPEAEVFFMDSHWDKRRPVKVLHSDPEDQSIVVVQTEYNMVD